MRLDLFGRIVSLESRKLMSYRVDFWLNVLVSFATQLAVAYFLWLAIFDYTGAETLGGFTFEGMVLYYVLAILLGRLVRGQERDLAVAQDIYQGTLTKFLLYPSDYFGFKYAAHLGDLVPGLIQLLLFGAVSLIVLELPPDLGITPATVVMAAVLVAVANLLTFLLRFTIMLIAFWADNVWSLNVMLRFSSELLGGLMLPLSLFPEWARAALAWTPFPYLFYVPVMTLLGEVPPSEWLRAVAVAAVWSAAMAGIALAVWRRGTLSYTGVGI
ncbi:MAG: ABC-2 family transporter protein [Thermoanaerobaculia bacterium]|nr:ABC-2 family transporter protein [Thermoanaerobaculia bacterium]